MEATRLEAGIMDLLTQVVLVMDRLTTLTEDMLTMEELADIINHHLHKGLFLQHRSQQLITMSTGVREPQQLTTLQLYTPETEVTLQTL